MDSPPIAIVKVRLDSLEFLGGREVDEKHVEELVEIFGKSYYGCDRDNELNLIPAYIDPDNIDGILEMSNLTREDLQLSLTSQNFRPRIDTGNLKIQCLHGQHRIEAAKRFLPPGELWWVIKLVDRLSAGYILKEGQRFSHEARCSDGEIYRRVRYYKEQDDLVQEWTLHLESKSKQKNLSWLLEREDYTENLDMLLIFPGLWVGFLLGNIRQLFALRCDEELQRYLKHMFEIWRIITLDSPEVQRSTNIETTQRLEGKAPFASRADRQSIIRDMNHKILFPNVTDEMIRQRVLDAILGLDVIIPTFRTFNENSKLLEIGVHVIRRELTDSRSGSLFNSLREIWSPPSSYSLETHEGVFRPVLLPNNVDHAYLVYFLIFLAALRQFPKLGAQPPRRDIRSVPLQAQIDPNYKTLFARRARFLGVSNRQIQQNCNLINGELSLTMSHRVASRRGKRGVETRWGRPFGHAHTQLQGELFILNLWRARLETTGEPSPMFIQQDFLRAFFSPHIFSAHWHEGLLPSFIATDLAANTSRQREDSIRQQRATRSMTGSLPVASPIHPAQIINNFDIPRESTTSPTTTSVASRRSELSRSSSVINTVRSSPRLHELTSQFMHTGIEINVRDQSIPAQTPEVTESELAESVPSSISPQSMQERGSDHAWERQSNCTTIIGSDNDSWTSGEASERSEGQDLVSVKNRPHRSYLRPRQRRHSEPGVEQRSLVNPRMNKQMGRERRRGRMRHRSFLTPGARGTRQRRRMRSSPVSNQNLRSPKGKGVLRENTTPSQIEHDMGNAGPVTFPQLDSSIEPKGLWDNGTRSVRSYLRLDHGAQQSTGSVFQARGSTPFQRDSSTKAMPLHDRGGARMVRSYLRLGEDREENQSVKGKEAVLEPENQPVVEFVEYNGMKLLQRSTTHLTEYLKRRKGWIGMVVIDGEPRSLRLDHITKYMENRASENSSQTLILVKQAHAERFRVNYPKL